MMLSPAEWPHDMNMIQRRAQNGNKYAQWQMSRAFHDGDGVPKNYDLALFWCRKSAENGFLDAMEDLGDPRMYHTLSPSETRQWSEKAMQAELNVKAVGPMTTVGGTGEAKSYGTDPTPYLKDIRMAEKMAESDDPEQFLTAMYMLQGPAEQGVARAEYALGMGCLHAMGMAFTRDQARRLQSLDIKTGLYSASHWLSLASKHGHGTAAVMLGDLNAQGTMDHGEPNMHVAAAMYARAQANGYPLEDKQQAVLDRYGKKGGGASGGSSTHGGSTANPSAKQSVPMPPRPAAPAGGAAPQPSNWQPGQPWAPGQTPQPGQAAPAAKNAAPAKQSGLGRVLVVLGIVLAVLWVVLLLFGGAKLWMLVLAVVLIVAGKVVSNKGNGGNGNNGSDGRQSQ
ncbi:tetratricopeptide repeat protein [Bifidobacterium stellenboschense]|nr:sel1 repeat family protein [Bifidobacterium stellenboschense]